MVKCQQVSSWKNFSNKHKTCCNRMPADINGQSKAQININVSVEFEKKKFNSSKLVKYFIITPSINIISLEQNILFFHNNKKMILIKTINHNF